MKSELEIWKKNPDFKGSGTAKELKVGNLTILSTTEDLANIVKLLRDAGYTVE